MIDAAGLATNPAVGHAIDLIGAGVIAALAYVLARVGNSIDRRENTTAQAFDKIDGKLDKHGEQLTTVVATMGPLAVEVEGHTAQITHLTTAVAQLQTWRDEHNRWSRETMAALRESGAVRRASDAL